ncbi:MAG: pilin [Microgenomates group bacterium]
MKRILTISALFLLASILVPKQTYAQDIPNGVCALSSAKPDDTCVNLGPSAQCGGVASHLVLWCCSSKGCKPPGGGSPFGNCPSGQIDTAIGCIPINDTNAFIGFILKWAIGIGGGIAFLLILFAGFQIMTSSGNPEKLKAGQELMTSAIAGLILLIFSVFILKIIGVDILQLPGFGE